MSAARLIGSIILPGVLVAMPSLAAEKWIKLTTEHFELYTTNNEKRGTEALKVFEQVRSYFLQSSSSKTAPSQPVRIIAFKSEREYQPYRLNGGAFAYYMRSRERDYIVMQDIESEHYPAAIHEYTHLELQFLGMTLPVWLNEGLADFYSSLEPKGNQAMVGRPIAGRMIDLSRQKWLDLRTLFAVDQSSPYYNEREKMSIFYSESWALVHMLEMGKAYSAQFPRFLAAEASGTPTEKCFQTIYGKSLDQVFSDLTAYWRQGTVLAALFDVKVDKKALEPDVSAPPQFEVDLALADLLATRPDTAPEAKRRLTEIAAKNPANAEVEESLGYLAWMSGGTQEARQHFGRAIELGSKDGHMVFQYADLQNRAGAPPKEVVALLQKALTLQPDLEDARFDLGVAASNAQEWALAISTLSQIKSVRPERAYMFFSVMGYSLLQLNDLAGAKKSVERSKQYAKTPDQQARAESLMKYIEDMDTRSKHPAAFVAAAPDAPDRPILRHRDATESTGAAGESPQVAHRYNGQTLQQAEGTMKDFDCSGRAPRIHVMVKDGMAKNQEMVFDLGDVNDILIRNTPTGHVDFNCGPQKPVHVTVYYLPEKDQASTKSSGVIKELEF